mmetsp:Transcript_1441/g.2890  ORF Transcript_1441/g.2890 Transcript_1441/m.2890 type:complete len:229 (+) Transcript_1441:61-747(+)
MGAPEAATDGAAGGYSDPPHGSHATAQRQGQGSAAEVHFTQRCGSGALGIGDARDLQGLDRRRRLGPLRHLVVGSEQGGEHVPQLLRQLRQVHRLLRGGGVAAVRGYASARCTIRCLAWQAGHQLSARAPTFVLGDQPRLRGARPAENRAWSAGERGGAGLEGHAGAHRGAHAQSGATSASRIPRLPTGRDPDAHPQPARVRGLGTHGRHAATRLYGDLGVLCVVQPV